MRPESVSRCQPSGAAQPAGQNAAVRFARARPEPLRFVPARSAPVKSAPVRSAPLRSARVRSARVRSAAFRLRGCLWLSYRTVRRPEDGGSGLYVGARCPLWWLCAWLGRWPLLAGVLPDECGEHLHHGRVVFGGIPGHPLEGVDAADAHVELVGAELLDGLGVAIGYLPLSGQVEVPCREDQGPAANKPSASVKEPSPRRVPRRLQQRWLGRADVMTRERVCERHEQSPHDRGRQHHSRDPCQPSDARWLGRPAFQHTQTLDGVGPGRSAVLRFAKAQAGRDPRRKTR